MKNDAAVVVVYILELLCAVLGFFQLVNLDLEKLVFPNTLSKERLAFGYVSILLCLECLLKPLLNELKIDYFLASTFESVGRSYLIS